MVSELRLGCLFRSLKFFRKTEFTSRDDRCGGGGCGGTGFGFTKEWYFENRVSLVGSGSHPFVVSN